MADWTSDTIPKNIMETLVVDDLAVNYEISAGTIQAKNAATAWVNFDGTTTPPTIRDSFNVKDVVRTSTGHYKIYFSKEMDTKHYSATGMTSNDNNSIAFEDDYSSEHEIGWLGVRVTNASNGASEDGNVVSVNVMGGKN